MVCTPQTNIGVQQDVFSYVPIREIKNQHGENLSDAEMARHLEAHLRSQQRKTRAWHRVKALHRLGGGRGVSLVAEDHADLLHQTKVAVESQNRPETSKVVSLTLFKCPAAGTPAAGP